MSRKITYTKHAEERIKMRKISKEVVHETLKNADQTINQGETKISQKVIGDTRKDTQVVNKNEDKA